MDITIAQFSDGTSTTDGLQLIGLIVVSFVVGLVGGLSGFALSALRLPFLLLLGIPTPIAAGTNIAISTVACLGGSLSYLRSGKVNLRVVLWVGLPTLIGGFLGGYMGHAVSEDAIILSISVLLFYLGVSALSRNWRGRDSHVAKNTPRQNANPLPTLTAMRVSLGGFLGFVIGLVGGAIGLILGGIQLASLTKAVRLPQINAIGTNLTISIILGLSGYIGHALRGEVNYVLVLFMGIAAFGGSFIGALISGKVRPGFLEILISIIYIGNAIALLRQAIVSFVTP